MILASGLPLFLLSHDQQLGGHGGRLLAGQLRPGLPHLPDQKRAAGGQLHLLLSGLNRVRVQVQEQLRGCLYRHLRLQHRQLQHQHGLRHQHCHRLLLQRNPYLGLRQ